MLQKAVAGYSMLMASDGQASTQVLHSVHFSAFTVAISSSSRVMASSGHSSTHVPQLTHSSLLTTAGIMNSSNFATRANLTRPQGRYIPFVFSSYARSLYLFRSLSSCLLALFQPLTAWRYPVILLMCSTSAESQAGHVSFSPEDTL